MAGYQTDYHNLTKTELDNKAQNTITLYYYAHLLVNSVLNRNITKTKIKSIMKTAKSDLDKLHNKIAKLDQDKTYCLLILKDTDKIKSNTPHNRLIDENFKIGLFESVEYNFRIIISNYTDTEKKYFVKQMLTTK